MPLVELACGGDRCDPRTIRDTWLSDDQAAWSEEDVQHGKTIGHTPAQKRDAVLAVLTKRKTIWRCAASSRSPSRRSIGGATSARGHGVRAR